MVEAADGGAQLARVWEDVLAVSPVGVHDPFLELGGDSLLAAEIWSRLDEVGAGELPPVALAHAGTVARLAEEASEFRCGGKIAAHVVFNADGGRLPLVYFHGDHLGGGLYVSRLAELVGLDQPIISFDPHGIDGRVIPRTIEAMARDRVGAVRELVPGGPYLLAGYAHVGGLVAYQVARELVRRGETVGALALVGTV
ncbi:MAG: thioesterase domain-containing protein, partial [Gaiellales bacterium]